MQAATDVSNQLQADFDGLTNASAAIKRPLDVIAHSEGGVVTRVLDLDAVFSQWSIKKVFTLGTPHSGTDWTLLPLWYGLDRSYMTQSFNNTYGAFKAPVYAITGRTASCWWPTDLVVWWSPTLLNPVD